MFWESSPITVTSSPGYTNSIASSRRILGNFILWNQLELPQAARAASRVTRPIAALRTISNSSTLCAASRANLHHMLSTPFHIWHRTRRAYRLICSMRNHRFNLRLASFSSGSRSSSELARGNTSQSLRHPSIGRRRLYCFLSSATICFTVTTCSFQASNADAAMNMAGSPTPTGYAAPMSAVAPLLIYLLTYLLAYFFIVFLVHHRPP